MERIHRNRIVLLVLAVSVLALGVVYRLIDLHVLRAEHLRDLAVRQHENEEALPANRGTIYDRRGRELAVTLRRFAVYANPKRIEDLDDAARRIARVTGASAARIRRDVERTDRAHLRVVHGIEPETARRLRALDLFRGDPPSFELEPELERSYPHDRLASHVVGVAGTGLIGRTGIEYALDDELLATPAFRRLERDGLGNRLVKEQLPPAKPHTDIVLTLDQVLQHVVERELERAMSETGARGASAVMLDPRTGEVLAMANRPAPRLNDYDVGLQNNAATSAVYEPGSTMKAFTAAALLEAGLVRPDTRFDCENGAWRYHGRTVRDHERFGRLTFREIIEHSSNVGVVKAALPLEGSALLATFRRFGFGAKTGLPIAEESGAFSDLAGNPVDKAWAAHGYGVNVTMIQMASALGALANGGVRVPPSLIRGRIDHTGRWLPAERPAARRVVSARTAATVAAMLEGVVGRGTGSGATVDGYRVAGKTGTSKRYLENVGYVEGRYWASFAGFAPVDDPRVVLVVRLDSPRSSIYGGATAAPVFSRILSETLAYLRVPPGDAQIAFLEDDPGAGARHASSAGGRP